MSNASPIKPANRAWAWSKSHSPLLRAWRWAARQVHRQALANSVIGEADVPAPIGKRINDITRRTRLWPTERADIARELIAHARDALDANRNIDDILSTLGESRDVAKLLRRSAKRKRHWLWQIRHRISQAILTTLGISLALYAILFIRFNTGSPDIKRNYIAELNQRNAGFTEDQHAWPAIEALWIEWTRESRRLDAIQLAQRNARSRQGTDPFEGRIEPPIMAFDMAANAAPEHVGYDEYRAFLRRIEPTIDIAAKAAHLPTIGGLYSDRTEEIELDDGNLKVTRTIPHADNPQDTDSVIGTLLPWLGQVRIVSNLLLVDAAFAARDSDADRVTDRIEASALYAALTADDHFLIASLLAIAMQLNTEQSLLRILRDQPDLFSEQDLVRLSHRLASTANKAQTMDLTWEYNAFDDILQRIFTDDGHGDGRLTASGFEDLLDEIAPVVGNRQAEDQFTGTTTPSNIGRIIGPVALLTVASRAEHADLYRRLMSHIDRAIDAPSAASSFDHLDDFEAEFNRTVVASDAYPVLRVMVPAMEKSVHTMYTARAHTGATLIALAAHIQHQRTGAWPASVEELVPHLLPEAPQDPFNPAHPLKIIVRDGQLIVYSVGADGDDDRGTAEPDGTGSFDHHTVRNLSARFGDQTTRAADPIPDADWVIYPPLD